MMNPRMLLADFPDLQEEILRSAEWPPMRQIVTARSYVDWEVENVKVEREKWRAAFAHEIESVKQCEERHRSLLRLLLRVNRAIVLLASEIAQMRAALVVATEYAPLWEQRPPDDWPGWNDVKSLSQYDGDLPDWMKGAHAQGALQACREAYPDLQSVSTQLHHLRALIVVRLAALAVLRGDLLKGDSPGASSGDLNQRP